MRKVHERKDHWNHKRQSKIMNFYARKFHCHHISIFPTPAFKLSMWNLFLSNFRLRNASRETWKCEGGNFRLFYIIDLAGHSKLTQPTNIAQRTSTVAPRVKNEISLFSFLRCLLFILFLSYEAAANFHVRIYLFNFKRFNAGVENIRLNARAKIIGNFSLNWTRDIWKGAKMENSIFFIVRLKDGHCRKVHNCEAEGRQEKYAKHRQTINIWTRILGTWRCGTSEQNRFSIHEGNGPMEIYMLASKKIADEKKLGQRFRKDFFWP